jgi:hypothetical protein
MYSAAGLRLLLRFLHTALQGIEVDKCLFVPMGFTNGREEHDMMMLVWRTAEDEYELTVCHVSRFAHDFPDCLQHLPTYQPPSL